MIHSGLESNPGNRRIIINQQLNPTHIILDIFLILFRTSGYDPVFIEYQSCVGSYCMLPGYFKPFNNHLFPENVHQVVIDTRLIDNIPIRYIPFSCPIGDFLGNHIAKFFFLSLG